jgi:arginase family enzyme
MRLEVIHLDDALTSQPRFLDACEKRGAVSVDIREEAKRIRLFGKTAELDRVSKALPPVDGPSLAFLGSGDFHHASAMLIERAAAYFREPFTVIHFDNHPDWVRFSGGMHCGSWVNRALSIPEVAKVITAGICSKDLQHPEWKGGNLAALRSGKLELFPYEQAPSSVRGQYGVGAGFRQHGSRIYWTCIGEMGLDAFADLLVSRVSTEAVYITLDKDVLVREDAVTNWDQGKLRLDDAMHLIRALAGKFSIFGADVIGDYSPVRYAGGPWRQVRKWGETLIDHPRVHLDASSIAATNEAANLRLLELFAGIAALHR